MHLFHLVGILTTLAATFAYINYHFLRMHRTIGLMLQSMLFSLVLIGLAWMGVDTIRPVQKLLASIDFNMFLLEGVLSLLLFAGALFVKNEELLNVKLDIALFATVGVIIATMLTGFGLLLVSNLLGLGIRPAFCLLFGALISPTDPMAVLPILRTHGIPDRLNAQIAGESLFNDGMGIVVFLTLLPLAGNQAITFGDISLLFLRETLGGLAFGALLGWLGYLLLKTVDEYQLEILITLAVVMGGYSLATTLGISGPLAMVIAGLFIGGPGRRHAMSQRTREHLDRFWELVEEMLNSVLFTLMGLEILAIIPRLSSSVALTAVSSIPLVLLARFMTVGVIATFLRCCGSLVPRTLSIMTWSGLRGAIPVALALSLPDVPERWKLMVATYAVVAFSILVQGTTLKRLVEVEPGK